MEPPISRRTAVKSIAAAVATTQIDTSFATDQTPVRKSGLGLVVYCCRLRRDAIRNATPAVDLSDPAQFLEHCLALGAGGMQVPLGILDESVASKLRERAAETGLFIEAIIGAPFESQQLETFEAQVKTAKAVGALAVRSTIIPGRRYEFFDSLEKFKEFDRRGRQAAERAAPIAEKHRIPIAIENHKDHRNEERIALFEHISSEFVGACVDTGNSFALLEDPLETVKALAPWAHSIHLKDQAVQLTDDGFLLGDIPLGEGFLDLKQMVRVLRAIRPNVRFSLELITRDPLHVPCLTEKYWATFPDVPGWNLARTLSQVRAGAARNLQAVSQLSPDHQLSQEDSNVRRSLDYARDQLKI